mmetsp:Transcript_6662/g.19499  ORF Transcript_6662/g.19499 Transcript_6662/m.19499 type:complete len:926 (-) Transcript_6662:3342-6119(-)
MPAMTTTATATATATTTASGFPSAATTADATIQLNPHAPAKTRPRAASTSSIAILGAPSSSSMSTSYATAPGTANSAATETAIDAYATRIIRRNSPPESFIDTSLGPYITAMLRGAELQDASEVRTLAEYDSLLELLEDQCNMSSKNAKITLISIARSICTKLIPDDQAFESFQSLGKALKEAAEEQQAKMAASHNSAAAEATASNHRRDRATSLVDMTTAATAEDSSSTQYQEYAPSQPLSSPSTKSSFPMSMMTTPSPSSSSSRIINDDVTGSEQQPSQHQALHEIDHDEVQPSATIHPYTPNPAGGPSPLKPDALIPVDLLGALDDPSPHVSRQRSRLSETEPVPEEEEEDDGGGGKAEEDDEEAFPPLGAMPAAVSKKAEKLGRIKKASKKTLTVNTNSVNGGATNANSTKNSSNKGAKSNKDLAALLFKPARPRQNSITESAPTSGGVSASGSSSSNNNDGTYSGLSLSLQKYPPTSTPQHGSTMMSSGSVDGNASAASASHSIDGGGSSPQHVHYSQQQLDSAIDILLSMNPDLCEEAAREAAIMAKADFNVAQYIIDASLSAPPICRHMLQDGCYRSDCAFSHVMDGHSCTFWMRGRCGKGASCKFKHGFSSSLLRGIKIDTAPISTTPKSVTGMAHTIPLPSSSSRRIPVPKGTPTSTFANPYGSPLLASSAPLTCGYVPGTSNAGFSLPSSAKGGFLSGPLVPSTSWQTSPQGASIIRSFSTPKHDDEQPKKQQQQQEPKKTAASGSTGTATMPPGAFSFANIATKGYDQSKKFVNNPNRADGNSSSSPTSSIRIPTDLWNPHESRDASAFYIADPIERYNTVSASIKRTDVVDLHFQSTKTFSVVLSKILPDKLTRHKQVWVVTGTGHHVGTKTHQKGGGALERAAVQWLETEGYKFVRGKDRNGMGGALLVKQR